MVEAIEEKLAGLSLQDGDGGLVDLKKEDFQKLLNDPRYLDSAEQEIEQMLTNAKVALTQLGYDIDKERLAHIEEEKKEEAESTEMERLK